MEKDTETDHHRNSAGTHVKLELAYIDKNGRLTSIDEVTRAELAEGLEKISIIFSSLRTIKRDSQREVFVPVPSFNVTGDFECRRKTSSTVSAECIAASVQTATEE
jgi:hypothetical protein